MIHRSQFGKAIEGIGIHDLRDILIPKVCKRDGFGFYVNNSARRLLLDVLDAASQKHIYLLDDVKDVIDQSSLEELVAYVNKPQSQYSKMVRRGDIKLAEFIRAVLMGSIRYSRVEE